MPGRVAATWLLAGLRFDDDGFELVVSAVLRRFIGTLLQSPCDWRDVESLRRNRFGVVVRLPDHQQVYLTAFSSKRVRGFVEAGRSHGVWIDE